VLDGTASAEQLGKTPGKDQQRGRDNLVEHLGLEQARREAEQAAEEARQAARTLLAGQPASDPARGGPAAWLMALPLALLARGR
jgi:geranylgeranyl pyrophosphate synthase